MLKFDLKNKFKNDGKDNAKKAEEESPNDSSKNLTADSVKSEIISSMLKGNVQESSVLVCVVTISSGNQALAVLI